MKHNLKYLPTLIFLVLSFHLAAQTQIAGGEVQGDWTIAGSPYQFMGDILVPDSTTLTIEPGVQVIAMGHYRLEVEGRVLAIGTESLPITFSAADTTVGWQGVWLASIDAANDTSHFSYCVFQYGNLWDTEPGGAGVMRIGFDKVVVRRCVFRKNKMLGNNFATGGAMGILAASPVIEQNLFTDNQAGHGGAIVIASGSEPVFNNNIVAGNTAFGGGGIFLFESSPVMINNTIVDNHATNHAGGLDMQHSEPIVINTILYNNSAGDHGQQVQMYMNFNADFINCAIEGGRAAIAQNHVDNGCPGCTGRFDNIIASDSTLENLTTKNFLLDPTSPCNHAGVAQVEVDGVTYQAPAVDYLGNPRPLPNGTMPDIGAVESESVVSVRDIPWIKPLFVFPNPASKTLIVRSIEPGQLTGAHVEFFDNHGRLVMVRQAEVSDASVCQFDISQLLSGVYSIRVSTHGRNYVGQFVVKPNNRP